MGIRKFSLLSAVAVVGGVTKPQIDLEGYCGGSLPANTWRSCTIPLSALQASNVSNLTGIQFKKRESPARVVHFDEVALQ